MGYVEALRQDGFIDVQLEISAAGHFYVEGFLDCHKATILVDKSIVDMPLDIVYALLCEVCYRLGHSKTA